MQRFDGKRLRAIRMAFGWTQGELSAQMGCTYSRESVAKLESGRMEPSLPALVALASVLNVEISELFTGGPEAPCTLPTATPVRPLALTTVPKAAERYNESDDTIYRRIHDGTITGYRTAGGAWRVDLIECDRVLLQKVGA